MAAAARRERPAVRQLAVWGEEECLLFVIRAWTFFWVNEN